MNRTAVLMLLALITLSSLAMIGSAFAQLIPKPSVPEFTVQIVSYPYDVPTTHSIDPFTGQNITQEGYHVENKSIEVRIKNQPFTPYQIQDSNGNEWTINLHYNIRIKGHFSEDWIELYRASDGYPIQHGKDDVVLSYVLEPNTDTVWGTKYVTIPAGGQVDFQVKAMIGYVHREVTMPVPGTGWLFTGETSGWSNTQTLIIGENLPSSTEPSVFQIATGIAIGVAIAAAVSVGLLVYFKKRKR